MIRGGWLALRCATARGTISKKKTMLRHDMPVRSISTPERCEQFPSRAAKAPFRRAYDLSPLGGTLSLSTTEKGPFSHGAVGGFAGGDDQLVSLLVLFVLCRGFRVQQNDAR